MHLFLIRHGESVDNVAGLYAGSRDSPLTAHGVLQARRLGAHLAARSAATGPILHIFASDLQRAADTAQAVVDAQLTASAEEHRAPLAVVRLPDLRERNFGSLEGVKYGPRSVSGSASNAHADAETRAEMQVRVDRFIELHLVPLFIDVESTSLSASASGSVVVVAHGIILNVLLRSLLSRFAPSELARLIHPGLGNMGHLASWSNTGCLEAVVRSDAAVRPPTGVASMGAVVGSGNSAVAVTAVSRPEPRIHLTVTAVNNVEHLQGLKKTRGGIGSAKFDSNQKTMDSFFKPTGKERV